MRKTIYKVTLEKDNFTIIRKRKQTDCPDSENKKQKTYPNQGTRTELNLVKTFSEVQIKNHIVQLKKSIRNAWKMPFKPLTRK
jgi:hypothetical protein